MSPPGKRLPAKRQPVRRGRRVKPNHVVTAARVYAEAGAADAFARRLLVAHGLPEQDAAIVAGCLVSADLRGVDTHGLCRLPGYLDRLRRGLINPRPVLEPKRVTPAAAALDGHNGFGFVVGMRAMREAIAIARELGIGVVAVRRSTHFGMAASYVLHALDAGFISLVFSNASPAMPPWGARTALLGTNPFAAGAPAGKHASFLLDMSPAVARAERSVAPRAAAKKSHRAMRSMPTAVRRRIRRPPSAAWCCRSAATRARGWPCSWIFSAA